jgi:hypothetical protein
MASAISYLPSSCLNSPNQRALGWVLALYRFAAAGEVTRRYRTPTGSRVTRGEKAPEPLLVTRILHGFGVDDQAAAPVLSPQPTPTACGRARLTSQVQILAPRHKGQVIQDPEPGPFR